MKKPNYSCVIFDMDGTLLYTIDDIAKSVNITLKEFGYPEKTIEEVTSFVNNGAYRLMELALPEDKRDKETVTTVLNRYLDIYDEHVCEKTHSLRRHCRAGRNAEEFRYQARRRVQ